VSPPDAIDNGLGGHDATGTRCYALRRAGIFGVVGTGFAVLLAFVIFIGFQSFTTAKRTQRSSRWPYDNFSNGHALRRRRPRGPARPAHLLRLGGRRRRVADHARAGRERARRRVARRVRADDPWHRAGDGEAGEAAYAHWLSQAAERQEGRRGRLAEAAPVVPPVVWAVLILAGLLVIGYVCLYADPAEPVLLQAFMMAAVVTLVVSGLLLVHFLDVRTRRAAVACVPPQWSG